MAEPPCCRPERVRPHARLYAVGTLTGRVHGSTIDLDALPSAPFEGKRVRVVLELVDDDVRLAAAEAARTKREQTAARRPPRSSIVAGKPTKH